MGRPRLSLAARIAAKTQRAGADECWLWLGKLGTNGYGVVAMYDHARQPKRYSLYAHRVAWELQHGPIPEGLTLDHVCAVRRCTNTRHLRLLPREEHGRIDAQRRWAKNKENTMGYSHYFPTRDAAALAAVLPQLGADTRQIVAEAGKREILLAGPLGSGEPVITDTEIALNGDESVGGDYESFVIGTEVRGFNFCKTAHRPYDAAVVAILLRAHALAPGALDISSDGDDDEWRDGRELYRVTFGTDAVIPPGVLAVPA